jgi:hypothetical protein
VIVLCFSKAAQNRIGDSSGLIVETAPNGSLQAISRFNSLLLAV